MSIPDTICSLPWIGLTVRTNGDVVPCCLAQRYRFGNTHQEKVEEILNSESATAFRKQMLAGHFPEVCAPCQYREKVIQVGSYRQAMNHRYLELAKAKIAVDDSGKLSDLRMAYFDVRLANTCNFKCRMCNPVSSSKWIADYEALGWERVGGREKNAFPSFEAFRDFFSAQLNSVQEMYFCGGEPLIIEDHYRVLDLLLERSRFDILLRYNSNLSVLEFRGKRILDYWKRFARVQLGASIDGSGARAEYVRHGTRWRDVEANWILLRQDCPHVELTINLTVQALNILHAPDFVEDWLERGLIEAAQVRFNLLTTPEHLGVTILPRPLLDQAIRRWRRHIHDLVKLPNHADAVASATAVVRQLLVAGLRPEADAENSRKRFVDYTAALDQLRGEDFRGAFPEIATHF